MASSKHLHSLEHFSKRQIVHLFSEIENSFDYVSFPEYPGVTVALAFLDPSLHTEIAFNMVISKMNLKVMNFRGMNLVDVATNPLRLLEKLELIGANLVVLRSDDEKLFTALEKFNIPTISAGCSSLGNPTEQLQDLYTIWAKFRNWSKLRILAIGDNASSLKMKSTLQLYEHLNFEVDQVCMSDFTSLTDFLNVVKMKSEGVNVFHLLKDNEDNFDDFSASINGYSSENINAFGIVINKFIDKESLIINSGTRKLSAIFDERIHDRLKEAEKQRMRNGVNVRMYLLHKMIKDYCFY